MRVLARLGVRHVMTAAAIQSDQPFARAAFATTRRAPVSPPIHVIQGTPESELTRLWRTIIEEQLAPALRTSSRQDFFAAFQRAAEQYERNMEALSVLARSGRHGVGGPALAEVIAQIAAGFGGLVWEDTVRDAWADINRRNTVFARLVDGPTSAQEAALALESTGAALGWTFGTSCLIALAGSSDLERTPTAVECVLEFIRSGAREAYIAVRQIETSRRQEEPELPIAAELSSEAAELEEEAEADSRELLERHERA